MWLVLVTNRCKMDKICWNGELILYVKIQIMSKKNLVCQIVFYIGLIVIYLLQFYFF